MRGLLPERQIQERREEVWALLAQLRNPLVLGMVSAREDGFILADANRSYITGSDAAAVICAHSSCERDLLSYVWHGEAGPPPKHIERWGHGRLIQHFAPQLPAGLSTRLIRLNESRKVLYHYGHGDSPGGLSARAVAAIEVDAAAVHADFEATHGRRADNKDILDFEIERVLRRDALDGLGTALTVREWLMNWA